MSDPHEHQFPEEMTPGGVRLLLPCLLCGLPAADAMAALGKMCIPHEFDHTVAPVRCRRCKQPWPLKPTVCADCGGFGIQTLDIMVGGTKHSTEERDCPTCKGSGAAPPLRPSVTHEDLQQTLLVCTAYFLGAKTYDDAIAALRKLAGA